MEQLESMYTGQCESFYAQIILVRRFCGMRQNVAGFVRQNVAGFVLLEVNDMEIFVTLFCIIAKLVHQNILPTSYWVEKDSY